MNKFSKFFSALFLALFTYSAHAVTTIPLPISEDYPLRLGGAITESTTFSPFAMTNLGGLVGVIYAFGGGFEGGFQVRGGVISPQLFDSAFKTEGQLAGDAVLRYLGNVTDVFYLGLSGKFGYSYTFDRENITKASNITAAVGVAFGLMYETWTIYAKPEIEFGRRSNPDDEVFGSLVGLGGAVGAIVKIGGPRLYLEITPKSTDIASTQNTFAIDVEFGVAFDM